jgi:N-acetylglutamate synthase-like GNAT family acetyltransferase
MSMIEVLQVRMGDESFFLFEEVARNLYADQMQKSQLAKGINFEFLHACYIIKRNKEVVGRAALYNNSSLGFKNKKAVCVGNYECINDDVCANELLQKIANDAKQLGANFIIGPMNGSTWDEYRFSTHHHYLNFLLEPYHHLYYNNQFVQFGFQPIANYVSNIDLSLVYDHPSILKREEELIKQGVAIIGIDVSNYENELRKLYPFICDSFSTNFLYTKISEQSFLNKYKEAKEIVNPAFVLIATDKSNDVVGFIFCYGDMYNKKEKQLVVKTVARHPSVQWKGLGHVMGNMVIRNAAQQGFTAAIHAFVIEKGTSTGLSDSFSGNHYKNYVLYGKEI